MRTWASVIRQLPKPGSAALGMQLKFSGHKNVFGCASPIWSHGSSTHRAPLAAAAVGCGAQRLMHAGSVVEEQEAGPPGHP